MRCSNDGATELIFKVGDLALFKYYYYYYYYLFIYLFIIFLSFCHL